jgi:hypothetical protein
MPSPSRLKPSTAMKMASPGQSIGHTLTSIKDFQYFASRVVLPVVLVESDNCELNPGPRLAWSYLCQGLLQLFANGVAALRPPVFDELVQVGQWRAASRDPRYAVENQLVQAEALAGGGW